MPDRRKCTPHTSKVVVSSYAVVRPPATSSNLAPGAPCRGSPGVLMPDQQHARTGTPARSAPNFYLTERQPVRPRVVLFAVVVAVAAAFSVAYGVGHSRRAHPAVERDDPNQVDTVVLGDAADAPTPARRGGHPSDVHATIIVRLPRFGDQVGLIPDSPAGHLLYGWLAAFNQANADALASTLPNAAFTSTTAAQLQLRQQTGGFNLLSAKEVQPGVIVFRLRDQTPLGTEVLGTLQVSPGSSPPAIASFSLREAS